MKRLYAVKVGKNPGIYHTLAECKKQVDRFPGAVFQKFDCLETANEFLYGTTPRNGSYPEATEDKNAILHAYIDGSFSESADKYGYGIVLVIKRKIVEELSGSGSDNPLSNMRNVAGELVGAQRAIKYAKTHGYKRLVIHHDYLGVANFCTKRWPPKNGTTRRYQEFYQEKSQHLDIRFEWVKAHTGNEFNERADDLARMALGKKP